MAFDPSLIERLRPLALEVTLSDGDAAFTPGEDGSAFLIPLKGAIRVEQINSSGRTLVLYRVEPGQSCVMTTTCLLSDTPYSAHGYAEGTVTALAIGASAFHNLLDSDRDFRAAVLETFSNRLLDLTHVVDELLLNRMDQKLALWLAERAPEIATTHQQIAAELGSAREVMSRLLKEFERRGWVVLSRGKIAIQNTDALRHLANSPTL